MKAFGVRCPDCGLTTSAVVDKRDVPGKIRRRRMCAQGHRFNTLEVILPPRVKVNKTRIKLLRASGYKLREISAKTGVSMSTVWWTLNDDRR